MLGISLFSMKSAWPLRPENFIFLKFLIGKNLVKQKCLYVFHYPSKRLFFGNNVSFVFLKLLLKKPKIISMLMILSRLFLIEFLY